MITSFLFDLAFLSLSGILSLFPVGSGFPVEVHSASISLGSYLGLLDSLVPITTLATVVGLVFVFESIIFGFKSAKWIASHLPFIGGRG